VREHVPRKPHKPRFRRNIAHSTAAAGVEPYPSIRPRGGGGKTAGREKTTKVKEIFELLESPWA